MSKYFIVIIILNSYLYHCNIC